MNPFSSLHEFFDQADIQFRIVDMGQRVQKLEKSQFKQFEAFELPYPYPFLKHAWFGLLFWPKQPLPTIEPVIWFLKLPLDELGQLQPAARDDLIRRLMEQFAHSAMSKQKQEQDREDLVSQTDQLMTDDLLKDNPYSFQPSQEKMAIFHSLSARWLKKPPSQYYQTCRSYLAGDQGWDHWQHLGLQGLADVAANLDIENNEKLVVNAIKHVPSDFLQYLGQCLENAELSPVLEQALLERLNNEQDNSIKLNLIRSLASRATSEEVQKNVGEQLEKNLSIETLAIIATRLQPALLNESFAIKWLEATAKYDDHTFMALLGDLMFQPKYRQVLMGCFRSPQRSEDLSKKIGLLFSN